MTVMLHNVLTRNELLNTQQSYNAAIKTTIHPSPVGGYHQKKIDGSTEAMIALPSIFLKDETAESSLEGMKS